LKDQLKDKNEAVADGDGDKADEPGLLQSLKRVVLSTGGGR